MAFDVQISPAASRDIRRYLNRFEEWAPLAIEEWHSRLIQAIGTLSDMPRRCPAAPESRHHRSEIRQLLFGPTPNRYRVLFRIKGRTVLVLRVYAPGESAGSPT